MDRFQFFLYELVDRGIDREGFDTPDRDLGLRPEIIPDFQGASHDQIEGLLLDFSFLHREVLPIAVVDQPSFLFPGFEISLHELQVMGFAKRFFEVFEWGEKLISEALVFEVDLVHQVCE